MPKTVIKTPAKINLYLKIKGCRPDGYHYMNTLMAPISLFDTLSITVDRLSSGIYVSCPNHPELNTAQNLAYKAARRWLEMTNRRYKITIEIDKKIPIAAGLGGGSSNAGAVLRALQKIESPSLSDAQLLDLAGELGADVPFFIQPRPGIFKGIGDILERHVELPEFWLILAVAPFGIKTIDIFKNLKYPLTFNSSDDSDQSPERGYKQLVAALMNDLQATSEGFYPMIQRVCDQLVTAGACGSSMTGSGPCVFGLFPSSIAAQRAIGNIEREQGWMYLVLRGINTVENDIERNN